MFELKKNPIFAFSRTIDLRYFLMTPIVTQTMEGAQWKEFTDRILENEGLVEVHFSVKSARKVSRDINTKVKAS